MANDDEFRWFDRPGRPAPEDEAKEWERPEPVSWDEYMDESLLPVEPSPEPFGRYEWFFLDTNAPGCADFADRILLRVTDEDATHIMGEAVRNDGAPVRPQRFHRIDKRVIAESGHWHP